MRKYHSAREERINAQQACEARIRRPGYQDVRFYRVGLDLDEQLDYLWAVCGKAA